MNVDSFYKALSDPALLSRMDTGELEQLVNHYPWFQAAQVMLTRAYKLKNDHRYVAQLGQAATCTGSRSLLFELVHTPLPQNAPDLTEPLAFRLPEGDQPKEPAPDSAPVLVQTSEASEHPKEQFEVHPAPVDFAPAVVDVQSSEPAPVIVQEQEIPSIETTSEERSLNLRHHALKEETVEESLPEEDNGPEVLTEEVAVEPELPSATGPVEMDEQPLSQPAEALDEVTQSIVVQAVYSSIEQEVAELAKKQREQAAARVETDRRQRESLSAKGMSYADWLAWRAEQLHYGTEPAPVEQPLKAPEYDDTLPTVAHGKTRLPDTRREHQRSLIDRFIQTDPKISPGKAADYPAQNLARESVEDDLSIVSETMARVLEAQGKIEKARAVYQKLIEQHPEKSVYFAARLKNLEKTKK